MAPLCLQFFSALILPPFQMFFCFFLYLNVVRVEQGSQLLNGWSSWKLCWAREETLPHYHAGFGDGRRFRAAALLLWSDGSLHAASGTRAGAPAFSSTPALLTRCPTPSTSLDLDHALLLLYNVTEISKLKLHLKN